MILYIQMPTDIQDSLQSVASPNKTKNGAEAGVGYWLYLSQEIENWALLLILGFIDVGISEVYREKHTSAQRRIAPVSNLYDLLTYRLPPDNIYPCINLLLMDY